jgi:hypothetical protein
MGAVNQDAVRREELRQHPSRQFVARGDPALTRALLARGALRVLDERRGKLVQVGVAATPESIAAAQAEVAATAGTRAVARERSRERREREEARYVVAFDAAVRRLFPSIPDRDRQEIVQRTCEVGSRRVGRSAAAKDLDDEPIRLAVRAWIRHGHTDYDQMLDRAGVGRPFGRASKEARRDARKEIGPRVDAVARAWAQPREVDVAPVAAQPAAPRTRVAAQPAAPRTPAPSRPVLRLLPPRSAAPEPAARAPLWGRPLARKR